MPENDLLSATQDAAPKFVGGPPRLRKIPLTYPVEFNGVVYKEIEIRRLTAKDVADFIENLCGDDRKAARLPVFGCPPEVIDGLDADDFDVVDKAALDFLPRALKQAIDTPPANGATTSP
jgi:hypothetical protein